MRSSSSSRAYLVSTVVFLGVLTLFLSIDTWMISPYLLALLMGAILAVLTQPLYRKLRQRGMGPRISALTMVLATILLVLIPLAVFGYLAAQQGIALSQSLSQGGAFDLEKILARINDWKSVRTLIGNPEQVEVQIQQALRNIAAGASGMILSILSSLPEKGLNAALALLTQYFFLIDGRKLLNWMNEKIPLDLEVRGQLYASFRDTAISTIWATLAAAAVQALIMLVAFLVLGVPGPFLAAGATFIFAWIPILGSTPVWIAGILYLSFAQDSVPKALLMLAFGTVTSIADNLVRPLVLKGRGDMHPLTALVAIFGGIHMFGLFGVFYGPILVAVFLSLAEVWPLVARRMGWVTLTTTPGAMGPGGSEQVKGLTRTEERPEKDRQADNRPS